MKIFIKLDSSLVLDKLLKCQRYAVITQIDKGILVNIFRDTPLNLIYRRL